MAANLDFELDPYGAQALQIAQRQRLAQQMVDQGMSNTPVYSDKAGIAKALMIAFGQAGAGQAAQQQIALSQQRQNDQRAEVDRIIGAATAQQGQPPVPAVPGGGPPASLAPNAPAGGAASVPGAPGGGRFALAEIMARSSNPQLAQAGLGMLLKGPDAPIVKETPDGGVIVLSSDGMRVLNKIGGGKITPPSLADATPESLAAYQRTGDPSVLVTRIKQVPVDTGSGTQFVNPEAPPSGPIQKTMSPGEAAANTRAVAELQDKGVRLPSGGGPGGPPAPGGPLSGGPLNYGDMGNVSPATQNARDGDRMSILLGERQQQIAQTGKSDPQLDIEIADMQRRGFGGAPAAQSSPGMSSVPGLSPADQRAVAASTAQALSKGGVDYKASLDTRVQSGSDLMMRINEAQQALDQFKPGMGADARLGVARAAQAIGASDSLVNRINGGDVSAKQEFQKLAAQQAMESLKQAMGGTGRITQAEFKIFQQNNPNIELDPNAIGKIFDFSRRVFTRDATEQSAMGDYLKNGGDISQWPTVWTQAQLRGGILTPQPKAASKSIVRTGTLNGRRVVQYSDGTTDYAN